MSEEIPEFKLTSAEVHSATWQRIKVHFEERLEEHRCLNDDNINPEATAKLRGQIKELKYLLAVGEPDLPAPMADHGE